MSSKGKGKTEDEKKQLPRKEQELYKSIAKFYETKQYKKGVKAADTVLKKFPEHGETQAMKALCLSCLDGKKEEAYLLVKEALRNDMRSHVCWHVQGLLHRADKEYLKAIRAYKQALKNEPGNMLILKDNSLLQVQMRDLKGFVESRRCILMEKPQVKLHWLAFAVAHHMAGNLVVAAQVLEQYSGTLQPGQRTKDIDESELVLYHNTLIEGTGDVGAALKHLEDNKDWVVDQHGFKSKRAELLLLLSGEEAGDRKARCEESLALWRCLMEDYSFENYAFHRGYMCALLELDPPTCAKVLQLKALDLVPHVVDLSPEQRAALTSAYEELAEAKPRSRALKRIPLTFLQEGSEAHTAALVAYMCKMVKDGMPALAADLSGLYTQRVGEQESKDSTGGAAAAVALELSDGSDPVTGRQASSHHPTRTSPSKAGELKRLKDPAAVRSHPVFLTVLKLAQDLLNNLKSTGVLALPSDAAAAAAAAVTAPSTNGYGCLEPPTCELWLLYLLAQLEEARGCYSAALKFIDDAILHTPTAVDMYERRARLLRKMGDIGAASQQMEIARKLDLQDRYINNKSTKYLFRCGNKREEAMGVFGMFTKQDGDPVQNTSDMQVLWVHNEWANSAFKDGALGVALKKWRQVEKHFEDYIDDQFDFHSYCWRRGSLRSYSSSLLLSNTLPHHVAYQRALTGLVKTYLFLHDAGPKARAQLAQGGSGDAEGGEGSGGGGGSGGDMSGMSAAEKKKAKLLARKAKAKQEKQQLAEAATKSKTPSDEKEGNGGGGEEKEEGAGDSKKASKFPPPPQAPPDPDPMGLRFLKALIPVEDEPKPTPGAAAAAADGVGQETLTGAAPLKKTTALAEAQGCVSCLLKFAPKALTTQHAAFDVACRRRKLLLALRSVLHASAANPDDPDTHLRILAFALGCKAGGILWGEASGGAVPAAAVAAPEGVTAATKGLFVCAGEVCAAGKTGVLGSAAKEALVAELGALLKGASLGEVAKKFADRHARVSLPHAVACARAVALLAAYGEPSPVSAAAAAELVVGSGSAPSSGRSGCTAATCEDASAVLSQDLVGAAASAQSSWKDACAEAWPLSTAFGASKAPLAGDASSEAVPCLETEGGSEP